MVSATQRAHCCFVYQAKLHALLGVGGLVFFKHLLFILCEASVLQGAGTWREGRMPCEERIRRSQSLF